MDSTLARESYPPADGEPGDVDADILVVDDNTANLIAIEAALSELPCGVTRAQSGSEALRLMLTRDFALVLLDVNMPSMGGFETARVIRARKRSRHTPIIFITAYGRDDRDVLAAYELGAVDFLFKPIVPQVLTAKAAVFVELKKRTAEVSAQAAQIREHERLAHERELSEERLRWQERAMRREMEQLADNDRKKDQFLAILAHELRTPLTPIVTGLALLRERFDPSSTEPSLLHTRDTMERQARYLTRLVDDLLDISRIGSGKIELRNALVDLRRVVREAANVCAPLLEERAHSLSLALPEHAVSVLGDEVRLIQIVSNLLNNAARYTKNGGKIEISCVEHEAQAELRVRDDGEGIRPEALPHIFEAFVQATPSTGDGLGLGLSVVARLVSLHGGTISAQSEGPGLGSEFVLRLPKQAVGALEATSTTAATSQRPPARAATRGLRVALVEDNDDIRDLLCSLLTRWDHQVVTADNGEAGVELICTTKPDVALVDIGLPMLDGYGVARQVRERIGRASQLVAMTGFGKETDREKARAAGFDVHLVKPVSAEALQQLFSQVEHSRNEDRDDSRPDQHQPATKEREEERQRAERP